MADIHRRKGRYSDEKTWSEPPMTQAGRKPSRISAASIASTSTMSTIGLLAAAIWLAMLWVHPMRSKIDQAPSSPLNSTDVEYHIIFSSGCSLKQDWQSYFFFYHAMVSNQPGTITRIASGCTDEGEEKLTKVFDEYIASMSPVPGRYRIHFTPDYSNQKPGADYKYWNKPYGTKHWMEHALGFPNNPQNENAIVILMDPDQIIERPFVNNDFSDSVWVDVDPVDGPRSHVEHGKPMGQRYAFGLQWKKKIKLEGLLHGKPSPISELTDDAAMAGYVVGPPYVATARDMYKIVTQWSEFAVPVYEQYPDLLAEMFAYCLAAAHLRLAHQTAVSFMVSDVGASEDEWWGSIDSLPATDACKPPASLQLPNVIHYCQRYGLGTWMFGKHRLPQDFLSCDLPLMKEPPDDVALLYNSVQWPDGTANNWTSAQVKRNAFAMCHMIRAANAAATYYKQKHCNHGEANYSKSLVFP